MLVLAQDTATVSMTRLQSASPPLSGTFSVEIFGQIVKGQIILPSFSMRYILTRFLLSESRITQCDV